MKKKPDESALAAIVADLGKRDDLTEAIRRGLTKDQIALLVLLLSLVPAANPFEARQ